MHIEGEKYFLKDVSVHKNILSFYPDPDEMMPSRFSLFVKVFI